MKNIFKTKQSKISGLGNFSTRDIPVETLLGIGIVNIRCSGKLDLDFIVTDLLKFINHSDMPNVYYKKDNNNYYLYALKDIYKDEELTIDYNQFDIEGNREFTEKIKTEGTNASGAMKRGCLYRGNGLFHSKRKNIKMKMDRSIIATMTPTY